MGLAQIDGLLLDLNGVFFSDGKLLPGATEVAKKLEGSRLPYRYVTNTTTMTRKGLLERLADMGLRLDEGHVLTPIQAAVSWLRAEGKQSVHLVIAEELKADFSDFESNPTHPEAIVIGDIGDRWNFSIMNHIFEMMMYGASLVALHKGRYWQTEGKLHIDIGAIVAGLEYATGHKAVVIGKPSHSFYEAALRELDLPASRVGMVGDDLESDIGGAQAVGIQGLLVRTGKFRESQLAASSTEPAIILENIGSLLELKELAW